MRSLLPLVVALLLVGCTPKPADDATAVSPANGGVAPMATTGAAGGMAPVTGAEEVGGGTGGGVGQAAKDMAHRAAGTPTAPSVPSDD